MLEVLATVSSEPEAEMVRDRLLAADIHAISQRTIGGPEWGYSGARNVMVDAKDLDRARAVLGSDESAFSDEELARLSEEAGREDEL
jgi:Putative prokaryotic signal transducing protein